MYILIIINLYMDTVTLHNFNTLKQCEKVATYVVTNTWNTATCQKK